MEGPLTAFLIAFAAEYRSSRGRAVARADPMKIINASSAALGDMVWEWTLFPRIYAKEFYAIVCLT